MRYHHMWVNNDCETTITRDCCFGDLVNQGYSGTPQFVRTFGSADFNVKTVVFTQQFVRRALYLVHVALLPC